MYPGSIYEGELEGRLPTVFLLRNYKIFSGGIIAN